MKHVKDIDVFILDDEQLAQILKGLNVKHRAFAREYVVDVNGTEAAKRAGYSERTAAQQASRLLKNANIMAYVMHLKAKVMIDVGITARRVLQELAKVALYNPADFVNYEDGNLTMRNFTDIEHPEVLKKIKTREINNGDGDAIGVAVEFEFLDKLKALELVGKHFKMFTENVNLLNNGGDLPQRVVHLTINHRAKGDKLTG